MHLWGGVASLFTAVERGWTRMGGKQIGILAFQGKATVGEAHHDDRSDPSHPSDSYPRNG